MRLPWHEAVIIRERLIIRWPAEEKRLRTLIFVPLFGVAAWIFLLFLGAMASPLLTRQTLPLELTLAAVLFVCGLLTIWFEPLWVLDRRNNTLLRGGWRKVAPLDAFVRFIAKRQKAGRDIVWLMLAEREDGTAENLGTMDQEDAYELGRELARFTRRPFSSR